MRFVPGNDPFEIKLDLPSDVAAHKARADAAEAKLVEVREAAVRLDAALVALLHGDPGARDLDLARSYLLTALVGLPQDLAAKRDRQAEDLQREHIRAEREELRAKHATDRAALAEANFTELCEVMTRHIEAQTRYLQTRDQMPSRSDRQLGGGASWAESMAAREAEIRATLAELAALLTKLPASPREDK